MTLDGVFWRILQFAIVHPAISNAGNEGIEIYLKIEALRWNESVGLR